ncbi:MAG: HU family DNA-binding protein [Acetobacteraceae bacterium]
MTVKEMGPAVATRRAFLSSAGEGGCEFKSRLRNAGTMVIPRPTGKYQARSGGANRYGVADCHHVVTAPLTREKTMPKAAPKTLSTANKPGKPAAPVTVTLKQVAAELAEKHALTKKGAEAILTDLVIITTRHLKKGARLRLTGLGTLQVRRRPARMGRNPATGEAIKIKASKKIAFRPAKELKNSI